VPEARLVLATGVDFELSPIIGGDASFLMQLE